MPNEPIQISFYVHPDGVPRLISQVRTNSQMSIARGSQLAMLSIIVEAIAARYVEEKFADIIAKIDGGTIATAVVEEIKQRVVNAMGIVQTPSEKQMQADMRNNKLANGICPECNEDFRHNKDWNFAPALNPEKAESLRERGIDFDTGHKNNCPLKGAI